jgi:hypothetical protein
MRWVGCSTIAAVLAVLGPTAAAADPSVRLTLDRHALHSGQQLVSTARAQASCSWVMSWGEQQRTGRGRTFTATFTAPRVTQATRISVRARCFPLETAPRTEIDRGSRSVLTTVRATQRLTVEVPTSISATVVVVVFPPAGAALPPAVVLPPTGGPARWLLLAGFIGVIGGAALARFGSAPRKLAVNQLLARTDTTWI